MSLIVRDKYFYKTVLAIAVPIALQNMVTSAVGMLDTIMLYAIAITLILMVTRRRIIPTTFLAISNFRNRSLLPIAFIALRFAVCIG